MTPRTRTAAIAVALAAAAAFAFWFFADPRYYPVAELDLRPYPLRLIDLDFPRVANGVEYYGKLKLNVYIGRDGGVDRVEVVSAAVPERFREAAVQAIGRTRWEPGRSGWRRVKSVKAYEIDFEPPVRGLGRSITAPGQ